MASRDPNHDVESIVVDNIIQHRGGPTRREYLVKWKHLDSSHNSWEPASIFDDISVITQYWNSLPSAYTHRSSRKSRS